MPTKIRYFAWVRERVGLAEEIVDVPVGVVTVAQLASWLKSRGAGYEAAFAEAGAIRAAINMTHVEPSAKLEPGAEVAFFPPVTGG